MRKVIASAFVSLDGVMQAPGGSEEDKSGGFKFGGWTWPLGDDVLGQAMTRIFHDRFELLLGRKTYEIFAAYWPYKDDPIGKAFNQARKYVATRTLKDLKWKNSTAIRDAAADVARLKQEDGPNLLIQGSSDLLQTLLAKDLIDEITLLIYPVVLGSGKRFFGKGAIPANFTNADPKISTTGVVIGNYHRAGPVKSGTLPDDGPPSADELARREKVKREG
jgi:dihydrofolate reductase